MYVRFTLPHRNLLLLFLLVYQLYLYLRSPLLFFLSAYFRSRSVSSPAYPLSITGRTCKSHDRCPPTPASFGRSTFPRGFLGDVKRVFIFTSDLTRFHTDLGNDLTAANAACVSITSIRSQRRSDVASFTVHSLQFNPLASGAYIS